MLTRGQSQAEAYNNPREATASPRPRSPSDDSSHPIYTEEEFVRVKAEKEEESRFLMHMAVGSLSRGSEEEERESKAPFLYHCLDVSRMLGLEQDVYDNDDGLAALQEAAREFQLSQTQTSKKPYKGLNLMSMPKEMVSKEEFEHEIELD